MREFISWIENDGCNLYLTTRELKSSQGKALKKRIGDDINGHGAIREFFDIAPGVGVEKECTDFGSPSNFPDDIAADIKAGLFRGFGTDAKLLTAEAQAAYERVKGPAQAAYERVKGPAWAEYQRVASQAWAEYQRVKGQAWAEYQRVAGPAWAEYQRVASPAWAEYQRVAGPAWAAYQRVKGPAWAECQRVKGPAWAEYQRVKGQAFWDLFAVKNNRAKAWRD